MAKKHPKDFAKRRSSSKPPQDFKRYFNIAQVILLAIGSDGVIQMINQEGCDVLGYPKEKIVGENWFKKFVPDRFKDQTKAYLKHLTSGKIKAEEYHENPILNKKGKERLIRWKNVLLKDKNGKIIGVLSSGVDITQRKEWEKKLQINEEKYRNLFESMAQGVVYQNAKGEITSANAAAEKILGLSLKQMQGKKSVDPQWKSIREDGSDFPGEEHPAMRALKTGKPIRDVTMGIFNPKKNDTVWIKVNAIPKFKKGQKKPYEVFTTFEDITAIKNAKAELDKMFNLTGYMACIADIEGNFKRLSPAWSKTLGWSREELMSKPFLDFVHPDDKKKTRKIIQTELKKGKEVFNFENRYQCKDGSYKWLAWTSKPNTKKNIVYAIAYDVTDRKKAETALRKSEKKYRETLSNISDLIVTINSDGKILFATPNVSSYGYDEEKVIGKNISQFIHPDDLDEVMKAFKKTLKTGKSFPTEFRLKKKNGDYIYAEEYGEPITEEGKIVRVNSVIRNISQRKETEIALRESEEKFRTLMEASPFSIQGYGTDGTIHHWNKASEKVYGYTEKEAIGKKLQDLIIPSDIMPIFKKALKIGKKAKKSGEFLPAGEVKLLKKDGSYVDVYSTHVIVKTKGAEPEMFCIDLDLSDQKKTEKALMESEERLNKAVQVSTDLIYEWDVKTDKLEWFGDIDKTLGYKKGTIAHTIKGWVSLIHPDDRPDLKEAVEFHRKATKKISVEYRIKKKDGSWAYWIDRAMPILDKKGKPVRWIGTCVDITKRKEAELALQESEEKARRVIENALETILVLQNNKIVYANTQADKVTGYSHKELLEKPFIHFVHPDDQEMVKERHIKRLKGEKVPQVYDFRILTKKGDTRWMKISAVTIPWEGKPAVLTFLEDITEQKKAERELKKFKLGIEHSDQAIFITDKEGIVTYVNPTFERLYGYKEKQILGKSRKLLNSKKQTKRFYKNFWQDLLEGKSLNVELLTKTKDDRRINIMESVNPIFDEKKEIVGFLSIQNDITEDKRIQEQLIKAEEKYRDIVENSPNMIHSVDEHGHIVFANQKECDLLGYPLEELMGMHIKNIYAPETWKEVQKGFEELKEKGMLFVSDGKMVKKNGEKIDVEIDSIAVYDRMGHFIQTRSIVRDVTGQKKMEQEVLAEKNRYQILFESSHDAIMTLEPPTWQFTSGNPATIQIFKAKNEEQFITKGPWDVSPKTQPDGTDSGKQAKAMIMKAMKEGSNFFEWTHQRLTGESFPATVLLTRMEVGGKTFLQATVRDITKQKKAEEELKKKVEQMEFMGRVNMKRFKRMMELEKENKLLKEQLKNLSQ